MASIAASAATPQAVIGHVQKLGDADPDFRFMSLNDLLQLLTTAREDFLQHDYNIAARTVDGIIKTLDDQNGEVQNLAIKWSVQPRGLHLFIPKLLTLYRLVVLGHLLAKFRLPLLPP